jgi:DNA topoisomerase VI subunit B
MAEVEIVQVAPVPVFVADCTPIIEITISARAGRDYGSLAVMDKGPGVPPQHR